MYPDTWRVAQASYERWASRRDQHLAEQPAIVDGPLVSVVMPVYNTAPQFLASAIESVLAQKYRNWQLCIADDASTDPGVAAVLRRFAALDRRIHVTCLDRNAGIAGASNRAAELAEGEFVALMDHDDVLHPAALNVVVRELAKSPQVKFAYTDSDHLDAEGRRCNPFFKPGWDYSRFLGQNYLNHLTVIRRDLLQECQGWRTGYEGSQDYELYLRIIERISDSEILHIPEVLYHWRDVPGSVARSNLARAVQAARLAIGHHLKRAGIDAAVKGCPNAIIYNRIEWPLPAAGVQLVVYGDSASDVEAARLALSAANEPLISHITPIVNTGDSRELLAAIYETLSTTSHEFFCIVDARLRPAKQDWLQRLASIAARTGVAAATGKLLRSDGRLSRTPGYQAEGTPEDTPPVWLEREDSKGYIASLCLDQEVASVPPDLLVAKTALLRQLQGLPAHCDSLDAAVRLVCRRATEQGHRLIWSPHVLFRYCGGDELSPPDDSAESTAGYGACIPARLPANPNCSEVEWEASWKESAE